MSRSIETRVHGLFRVEGSGGLHVITASGKLPSELYQKHHGTHEGTLHEIGIRVMGRIATVDRRLPSGDILYVAKQEVPEQAIQPGYRVATLKHPLLDVDHNIWS